MVICFWSNTYMMEVEPVLSLILNICRWIQSLKLQVSSVEHGDVSNHPDAGECLVVMNF